MRTALKPTCWGKRRGPRIAVRGVETPASDPCAGRVRHHVLCGAAGIRANHPRSPPSGVDALIHGRRARCRLPHRGRPRLGVRRILERSRADCASSDRRRAEGCAPRACARRTRLGRGSARYHLLLRHSRWRTLRRGTHRVDGRCPALNLGRRAPIRGHEPGEGSGVLRGRDRRGNPERPRAGRRPPRIRPHILLLLQREADRPRRDRPQAQCGNRVGGKRAKGREPDEDHGAARQHLRRLSRLVSDLRPRPDGHLPGARGDRPRRSRRSQSEAAPRQGAEHEVDEDQQPRSP